MLPRNKIQQKQDERFRQGPKKLNQRNFENLHAGHAGGDEDRAAEEMGDLSEDERLPGMIFKMFFQPHDRAPA